MWKFKKEEVKGLPRLPRLLLLLPRRLSLLRAVTRRRPGARRGRCAASARGLPRGAGERFFLGLRGMRERDKTTSSSLREIQIQKEPKIDICTHIRRAFPPILTKRDSERERKLESKLRGGKREVFFQRLRVYFLHFCKNVFCDEFSFYFTNAVSPQTLLRRDRGRAQLAQQGVECR